MNDKRIKLSIIIPCYNEEATISQIIEKIIINSPFNNEIIVIDDCSTDKSKKILESNLKNKISKLIINEKNYGKGYSIRKGIEVCSGDIVLIQDADLEYDPSDYVRLVSPIVNGEGDVVYGSRFIGTEKRKVLYYWHSVGNKILTTFSNMLSNLNLTDIQEVERVQLSNYNKMVLAFYALWAIQSAQVKQIYKNITAWRIKDNQLQNRCKHKTGTTNWMTIKYLILPVEAEYSFKKVDKTE